MTISANFPALKPSLLLDFANVERLDPRITFTRASNATYFDANGVLQTASSGVARFDHNPTTLQSLGLLIEEQRTNSIRNNTMQGAVAGTPGTLPTNWDYFSGVPSGLTTSIVGTGIENGITYIDLRLNGTASSASPSELSIDFGSAATGQTWTASTYWKLAGGSASNITSVSIGQVETTSANAFVAGAFVSQTIPTSASLSSQKVEYTRTLSGGATVARVFWRVRITPVNGAAIDITLRIGLPQLEQGAFATSVIPTTVAAATRNADVPSMTGTNFSSWYNATEGTIFVDVISAPVNTIAQRYFTISDGTVSNAIFGRRTTIGRSQVAVTTGTTQGDINSGSAIAGGESFKTAFAYQVDNLAISTNANTVGTDTSAVIPVVTFMNIGSSDAATQLLNGHIRRIAYYPVRLSNDQLQALTR